MKLACIKPLQLLLFLSPPPKSRALFRLNVSHVHYFFLVVFKREWRIFKRARNSLALIRRSL